MMAREVNHPFCFSDIWASFAAVFPSLLSAPRKRRNQHFLYVNCSKVAYHLFQSTVVKVNSHPFILLSKLTSLFY